MNVKGKFSPYLMLSSGANEGDVSIIGGKVESVVVEGSVVLSDCLFAAELPKPATATESFAVDLRFLASIGDSDLLNAPPECNENVLQSPKDPNSVYLTCSENTQDKYSCHKPDANDPAQSVLVCLGALILCHV